MIRVDESKLNRTDRLGLAWCRLNCGVWDEILGPMPDGFEDLPLVTLERRIFQKKQPCKFDFIAPAKRAIVSIVGEANVSRCWWLFVLGKTEDEWLQWYVGQFKKES